MTAYLPGAARRPVVTATNFFENKDASHGGR